MTARTNAAAAQADTPMPGQEAKTYQQLREHLDTLKLATAAESLSTVLDAARAQGPVGDRGARATARPGGGGRRGPPSRRAAALRLPARSAE